MGQRREQQDRHGVFVDVGPGDCIEVTVWAQGKRVMRQQWDPEYFEDAWVTRWQKWLDRRHPRLHVVKGGAQ